MFGLLAAFAAFGLAHEGLEVVKEMHQDTKRMWDDTHHLLEQTEKTVKETKAEMEKQCNQFDTLRMETNKNTFVRFKEIAKKVKLSESIQKMNRPVELKFSEPAIIGEGYKEPGHFDKCAYSRYRAFGVGNPGERRR